MQYLPALKPNDAVAIIAPASRCSEKTLSLRTELLTSWQLNCIVAKDLFGTDFLFANSDENRILALHRSLNDPDIKAIFCVSGGYGSMRLIPSLLKFVPPT